MFFWFLHRWVSSGEHPVICYTKHMTLLSALLLQRGQFARALHGMWPQLSDVALALHATDHGFEPWWWHLQGGLGNNPIEIQHIIV